ncbi:MAG: winged helix DNA-binding protein [Tannerella sp.]|jgi:DNA-binding MarR family transcriptional regulator|nr:winged helix DNA-binding protein [Tannerella sp.]
MEAVGRNICKIRDIYRSIMSFEADFQLKYGLCLNEGMLLCTLQSGKLSSKELAQSLGLTHSNTSKIIKSLEDKMLIKRILGKTDKRQMYFTLTAKGNDKLAAINCEEHGISPILDNMVNILQTDNYNSITYKMIDK